MELATEKQVDYIRKLIRKPYQTEAEWFISYALEADYSQLTKKQASTLIDALQFVDTISLLEKCLSDTAFAQLLGEKVKQFMAFADTLPDNSVEDYDHLHALFEASLLKVESAPFVIKDFASAENYVHQAKVALPEQYPATKVFKKTKTKRDFFGKLFDAMAQNWGDVMNTKYPSPHKELEGVAPYDENEPYADSERAKRTATYVYVISGLMPEEALL